jgi:two-component system sensor histidine kinase RegB
MAGRFSEPLGEGVEVQPLDDAIEATLGGLMPAERARVRWARAPEPSLVAWPPGLIARAIVNIVRNALQASPAQAGVDLLSSAEAGTVTIRIIDTGTGMPEDVLARAGEPFYTTKPPGEGTGLGLFVARSTVEQLGGRVTISSREGTGTTVTVTLPSELSLPVGP